MFLVFFQLIQDRMKANEYSGAFLSSILEVLQIWPEIYQEVLTQAIAYDTLHYGRSGDT